MAADLQLWLKKYPPRSHNDSRWSAPAVHAGEIAVAQSLEAGSPSAMCCMLHSASASVWQFRRAIVSPAGFLLSWRANDLNQRVLDKIHEIVTAADTSKGAFQILLTGEMLASRRVVRPRAWHLHMTMLTLCCIDGISEG